MRQHTRRETRAHVRDARRRIADDTQEIRHSDQSALGISTDMAMEAIQRGTQSRGE